MILDFGMWQLETRKNLALSVCIVTSFHRSIVPSFHRYLSLQTASVLYSAGGASSGINNIYLNEKVPRRRALFNWPWYMAWKYLDLCIGYLGNPPCANVITRIQPFQVPGHGSSTDLDVIIIEKHLFRPLTARRARRPYAGFLGAKT